MADIIPTPVFYIIILFVAFFIAMALITFYTNKKRREAMQNSAMQIGFSFTPKPDITFINQYSRIKIFTEGRSKKISNLIQGSRGGNSWKIFDYNYLIGSGKSSERYHQTLALRALKKPLPNFILHPENFFHKIWKKFGYKDINFDAYPNFSKKFLLRGKDEEGIRKAFNSNILSYFDSNPDNIFIESDGAYIVYYKLKKQIKPNDLNTFIEEASKLLDMFDK